MLRKPKKRTLLQRTGAAFQRTDGALDRTWVALRGTGGAPDRTGDAIERPRHVLPLEPAAAHTAGPLIPIRASRWKILFTPYLVVDLSSSAEIWCVYVSSINGGTQILTFLRIHNNRDFPISRFFDGNLIILNPELP